MILCLIFLLKIQILYQKIHSIKTIVKVITSIFEFIHQLLNLNASLHMSTIEAFDCLVFQTTSYSSYMR